MPLTDGELDHTVGLLMLREGSPLDVYGPGPVLDALKYSFPVRPILDQYGSLSWHTVSPGVTIALDEQLSARAIPLGVKRPRYVRPTVPGTSPEDHPAASNPSPWPMELKQRTHGWWPTGSRTA